MPLAPLLSAIAAIQLRAFAAMNAFALGVIQFAAPKGNPAASDDRVDLGRAFAIEGPRLHPLAAARAGEGSEQNASDSAPSRSVVSASPPSTNVTPGTRSNPARR
jgi:hypothetical protein